jgi:hypothetical protein
VCCLEYSAPYAFDGFALLSRVERAPDLFASFADSPDIINVGVFILLVIFAVGWAAYAVELCTNPGSAGSGGTVGRWVYWSITTYSSVGFGGAMRFRCALWLVRGAYRGAECGARARADACACACGVCADVVPM